MCVHVKEEEEEGWGRKRGSGREGGREGGRGERGIHRTQEMTTMSQTSALADYAQPLLYFMLCQHSCPLMFSITLAS